MAILMISEAQGVTAPVYTQVLGALRAKMEQAPGFILHTAHPVEGGFRIVELWQSKQESDRFFAENVASNLPPGVRPKRRTEELHGLVTPSAAA
jgi:hypothetical protein